MGMPLNRQGGRVRAPWGRARENRKFIQAPSPEIWSETISGGEEVLAGKWGGLRGPGSAPRSSHNLCISLVCGKRRPHELQHQSRRSVSADRPLCRPHSQGNEASRSAGRAADQVRARDQPQNRKGARPHNSARRARHRRRGDRMIQRRAFITLLGGAAAWPLTARAQQQLPVIGFLRSTVASGFEHLETALRHGLDEEGFVEGRNVVIEYRYADNQRDRLPALVDDLIRRSVAVIVIEKNNLDVARMLDDWMQANVR